MSKLYKVKNWYTLNDAAQRLSSTLGEAVSKSDLLQLSLEGHIRLSWQLTHQYAQEVAPVTYLFNWFGGESTDPTYLPPFPKKDAPTSSEIRRSASSDYHSQSNFVESLSGIYELLVSTPVIREWLLLQITSGVLAPEPKLITLEGVFVRDDKGRLLRLMERFKKEDNVKLKLPYSSEDNFFPAQIYPDLNDLTFRRMDLEKFEQNVMTAGGSTAVLTPGELFVAKVRIEQLKKASGTRLDCTRLVAMCEELNACAVGNNPHAVAMLTRAILNHVPPIFGFNTFAAVAAQYAGGSSFKQVADRLENVSRKLADRLTHDPIAKAEVLPTMVQVNFRPELDLVLSEVLRLLK